MPHERRRALAERQVGACPGPTGRRSRKRSITPIRAPRLRDRRRRGAPAAARTSSSAAIAASAPSRAPRGLVGHDVYGRAVAVCVLQDARDRDLALGQLHGDAGEHARPVVDREVEVEGRAVLADRHPGQLAPDRVVLEEARAHRPDHARHVGDHRGGRLDSAGARALRRDLADRVALEHDRVERALDRGGRMAAVDERRARR